MISIFGFSFMIFRKGFISENILRSVGNFIGTFVKADPASLDGILKSFVRIRDR